MLFLLVTDTKSEKLRTLTTNNTRFGQCSNKVVDWNLFYEEQRQKEAEYVKRYNEALK